MSDKRVSVWILGDQLLARHPALVAAERDHSRENLQFVLVESAARSRRLRYLRKKLVLLFSAMRHYAAALREQGYSVDYIQAPTFLTGLRPTSSTGAFSWSTKTSCGPIPGWAATCWVFASWTRMSGKRYAAGPYLFGQVGLSWGEPWVASGV